MQNRSAVDTIAGYFYQFDHSILSLLSLTNDTETVSLECIEDVDIATANDVTAIQCKYYAKTEYNHSVIKPAIMAMLTHFAELRKSGKGPIKYRLWGHFSSGQQKLSLPIDIPFLIENFLSYSKDKVTYRRDIDLGLDEKALIEFLKLVLIDINASSFDDQYGEIVALLRKQFKCSEYQAEYFFYNNALAVVRDLSIAAEQADRTISRGDFMNRINTSSVLFGEWFVALKGKKAYHAGLRKELFTGLNLSPFERFFLIEIDTANHHRHELTSLLHVISKKYSKTVKHEPHPFCPYVYLHGIDEVELRDLKTELYQADFPIIDGHDFKGAHFDVTSIQRQANHANGIRLKLLNTLDDVAETVTAITKTRQIYQFYFNKPYCALKHPSVAHICIRIEQLNDINQII